MVVYSKKMFIFANDICLTPELTSKESTSVKVNTLQ